MFSRRNFIHFSALSGISLLGVPFHPVFATLPESDPLSLLSTELLHSWVDALLPLQLTDQAKPEQFGGLWCPACQKIHGRVCDAFYPLLFLAGQTNNRKYLDSAVLLYRWMERNVSQPDGSWLNDPEKSSWRGITVFTSIALAESLKNHGKLLEPSFRKEIEQRLRKSGEYIYNNFSMSYGNINYPISASYCLSLLGILLDSKEFREKGRMFARESLAFISTKDRFIHGEGGPINQPSAKGCFSVDLGYNVEESLPALVMYAKRTNDHEVTDALVPVLRTHMEFMLPDGGWDNSWGTRNFKWTYWGSRTTDGCHPAYALMADIDPLFYKVALKSTKILAKSTNNGLLYGGPHYLSHGVKPCVHHTFCHAKSLATILDHGIHPIKPDVKTLELPREKIYGSRFFEDIQTALISVGGFRATVTAYDREYTMKNGHATGGALSLLWHEKTGPLLVASMNEYQMKEPNNMQPDTDPNSMPLTPRIELNVGGRFMNICDLSASMEIKQDGDVTEVIARSNLVDKDQNAPAAEVIGCKTIYRFSSEKIVLEFESVSTNYQEAIRVVVPVVSQSTEEFEIISEKEVRIFKETAVVKITSDSEIVVLPTSGKRIFNFVPGLEAIPLAVNSLKAKIEIAVFQKF